MKFYSISKKQLVVFWVTGIVVFLSLMVAAADSYNNSSLYFILGILVLAFLFFYSFGWKEKHAVGEKNKKTSSTRPQNLTDDEKEYIKKWSWGALGLNWIWALASRLKWYTLLYFIPYFSVIPSIYFIFKGREFSWKKGGWKNFNEYKVRQTKLDKIGKILFFVWIVIVVVGIFGTLLILQLGTARSSARDAKRIADVNQVRAALELYFDDNGHYPTDSNLQNFLVPRYLIDIPQDPLSNSCRGYSGSVNCYGYVHGSSDGVTTNQYHLWAELEQLSSVLSSDADVDSRAVGGVDGSIENCSSPDLIDCVYDL